MMSDKDKTPRRRSFKDINREFDFLDKGVEGLKERKKRTKSNKNSRKSMPKKRRPRQRPSAEELGQTMRMTPEMIERERRRIERKRREERRKKERKQRIFIGIGIILLLLLIFYLVKVLGASGEEKPEETTTPVEEQQEQKPDINETTGQLQKFSRTNKITTMYKDPSAESEEMETIDKDLYVENYGVNDDYTKVFIDGKIGYVKTVDLSNIEDEMMFKVEKGLLIANDIYYLPSDYNPSQDVDAKKAFDIMVESAAKENIQLKAVADQRSFEQQKILYEQFVSDMGEKDAKRHVAAPGHSEAQAGLLYEIMGEDYDKKASSDFDDTEESRWLEDNAYKYGFILRFPKGKEEITGREYQSWCYRYVGVEAAKEMYEQGITLEEYLGLAVKPEREENFTDEDNTQSDQKDEQEEGENPSTGGWNQEEEPSENSSDGDNQNSENQNSNNNQNDDSQSNNNSQSDENQDENQSNDND
ncbi:MAG: M15 family metallopeptidase [Tissierellia bacterium]|nr:M15 family metallopeptidase [Tissierellia bacterium]